MTFKVVLKKDVTKVLKKLSKTDRVRIYRTIERLKDPFSLDIRKLRGLEDTYAVRIGDFRIVFKIYFDRKLVFVIRIDKRKRVYKRL
jgi:mRNA interferase RelE/StbE